MTWVKQSQLLVLGLGQLWHYIEAKLSQHKRTLTSHIKSHFVNLNQKKFICETCDKVGHILLTNLLITETFPLLKFKNNMTNFSNIFAGI